MDKKNTVLLAVNSRWTHSNLALFYLKNSIADLRFPAEILECTINQPLTEILEKIFSLQPKILAISVYIWNVEIVCSILPEIPKILPGCVIILGGPEVSFQPEKWLKNFPFISHIVCGEGELLFREILLEK